MSDADQKQDTAQGHVHRSYGPDPRQMLAPRAEGYRPAVIRESRIKDRPYKPARDNLSIKIELDLEVEVRLLYEWDRGYPWTGLMDMAVLG